MHCLDSNRLAAYLAHELDAARVREVEAHLDDCASCRELVAELGRVRALDVSQPTPRISPELLPSGRASAPEFPDAGLPVIGDVIAGRFEIERELGRGGMGVVLSARDRELGTRVALKFLSPKLGAKAGVVDRLKREVVLARRVSHPRVCRIFDFGREGQRFFLSMELVDGMPLSRMLAIREMSFPDRLRMFDEILDALAAIHAEGVVHRDLKPGNVLVQMDGHIVLTDFGLAGEVNNEKMLDSVVGTPLFWAPEQAAGQGAEPASDVYSAGRIAQDLFGTTLDSLPSLRQFVTRCLQPFPRDRYTTAVEARRAFALVLRDLPPDVQMERPRGGRVARAIVRESSASSLERRVVVLMRAVEVDKPDVLAGLLEERGASIVAASEREVVAVFGLTVWEGDEPIRATRIALERRDDAQRIAVVMGAFDVQSLTLAEETAAMLDDASRRDRLGVVATRLIADALGGRFVLENVDDELVEIVAERAELVMDSVLPTRFVGYGTELGQLRLIMERVSSSGASHVVEISGVPGVGKSRIVSEFGYHLATLASSPVVFSAELEPLDEHRGFSLLGRFLASRGRARSASARGLRMDASSKVERRHALVDVAREAVDGTRARDVGSAFAAMLDLDQSRDDASSTPHIRADRVRAAWAEYFEGLSRRAPLVFVIDNLQWADLASIDLLTSLLEAPLDHGFLLVATSRPGGTLEVRRERLRGLPVATTTLHLRGLSESEARDFLAAQLEYSSLSPEMLGNDIISRGEGNPFFLEQLLRAAEQSSIAEPSSQSSSGSISAIGPSNAVDLPARIEAALQWRLDHLSSTAREACRVASITRTSFDVDALTQMGIAHAAEACRELLSAGLIRRTQHRAQSEMTYQFASELTARVAYLSLTESQRKALHLRFAGVLQARNANADVLALHCELAGDLERAAMYYAEAAHEASRKGDSRGVIDASDRARGLGVTLSDGGYLLHVARAEALRFLGDREAQRLELDAALLAASTDEQRSLVLRQQAFHFARSHQLQDALERAERALELARASGMSETILLALCALTYVRGYLGDTDGTRECVEEIRERRTVTLPMWIVAQVDDACGMAATLEGDVGAARALYERVRIEYEACGRPREAASAAVYLADISNRLGRYGDAIEALLAARRDCVRLGNRTGEVYALANLAYAELRSHKFAAAYETLSECARINAVLQDARVGAYSDFYRALALDGLGRAQEAFVAAQKLIVQTDASKLSPVEVRAEAFLSRLALRANDAGLALVHAKRSLEGFDALGALDEDEAEVVLDCVAALRVNGQTQEADARITKARDRVAQLAARIHEPSTRRAFMTAVEAHARLFT